MKIYKFEHQLGTATIRVHEDGTATFNRKRYASYKSARQALIRFCGFAWKVK